jgi:hypothetical protein
MLPSAPTRVEMRHEDTKELTVAQRPRLLQRQQELQKAALAQAVAASAAALGAGAGAAGVGAGAHAAVAATPQLPSARTRIGIDR